MQLVKFLMPILLITAFFSLGFADIATGLVAYYPFNDDALDESSNSNNGQIVGAQFVEDRFGNEASALHFDGPTTPYPPDGDWVMVPDDPSLDLTTSLTLAAWVYLDNSSDPDHKVIVGKWYDGYTSSAYANAAYIIEIDKYNNYLQLSLHTPDGSPNGRFESFKITDAPLPDNAWVFVAGTWDGENVYICINGELKGPFAKTGAIYSGTSPLMIGAHYNPNDQNPMYGSIDDVRVYNRALTPDDIIELYNETPVPPIPVFTMSGFQPPMAKGAVKCKKNRALPIKMELFDADGYEITSQDIVNPPVIQITYTSEAGKSEDVSDSALSVGEGSEGNKFTFTEDGIWQYNLMTKNYTAVGTYTITVTGNNEEYTIDENYTPAIFVIDD